MKRNYLAVLTACLILFSCIACVSPDNSSNNGGSSNDNTPIIGTQECEIWSAAATEKILASEKASSYDSIRKNSITLSSAKNEYESGQIVVTAKDDLSFTVELSDLVHTSSNYKITKDNFKVYTLTYTRVARNYYGNGAPTGWYPDGMLPQKNAVEYKKNVVKAGQNGGAWLSFFIPEDAMSGNYTGKATVTVGSKKVDMPITLKVYDVTVPTESSMKTLFGGHGGVYQMELDTSIEMQEKYTQFFLDYRVALTHVMTHGTAAESIVEDWYYWHKKGISTLGVYGDTMENVRAQIIGCARKSLEINENMVKKIAYFPSDIDEPFLWQNTTGIVSGKVESWRQTIESIIAELEADPTFDTKFGKELIESVGKIAFVVTDYTTDAYGNAHRYYDILRDENGNPWHYPDYVSICGKPDGFASKEEMAGYYNGAEMWWYNCNDPRNPYPTYQIDDSLVSQNAISWFMGEYDIIGNLYWNTTYHMEGSDGGATFLEDPYTNPDRQSGANGDGFLVYPGKMYGVDGPVATIRLDAIRDGNEDYELIKILKQKYAEQGLSANKIINLLTKSIYNCSVMIGGSPEFEAARERLLSLVELATTEVGVFVSDIEEHNQDGVSSYTLKATTLAGTELYSDGVKLTAQNGVYSVTKDLSEDKNYFELKAVHGNKEVEFNFYLGGKQLLYRTPDTFDTYNISGAVNGVARIGDYWMMNVTGESDKFNEIIIKHESVMQISKNTAKYIINLYNYGFTDVSYRIYVTYSKYGKVQALTGTLKPGSNKLLLDFFATANWDRNGEVQQLSIAVTGTDRLGIGSIIIYGV
ncbi:MAG: DUF4091 domain-containing protein [Clostridia bacterium]|nr:DUF4091 domain-containing protein [Clostridia bacterium]